MTSNLEATLSIDDSTSEEEDFKQAEETLDDDVYIDAPSFHLSGDILESSIPDASIPFVKVLPNDNEAAVEAPKVDEFDGGILESESFDVHVEDIVNKQNEVCSSGFCSSGSPSPYVNFPFVRVSTDGDEYMMKDSVGVYDLTQLVSEESHDISVKTYLSKDSIFNGTREGNASSFDISRKNEDYKVIDSLKLNQDSSIISEFKRDLLVENRERPSEELVMESKHPLKNIEQNLVTRDSIVDTTLDVLSHRIKETNDPEHEQTEESRKVIFAGHETDVEILADNDGDKVVEKLHLNEPINVISKFKENYELENLKDSLDDEPNKPVDGTDIFKEDPLVELEHRLEVKSVTDTISIDLLDQVNVIVGVPENDDSEIQQMDMPICECLPFTNGHVRRMNDVELVDPVGSGVYTNIKKSVESEMNLNIKTAALETLQVNTEFFGVVQKDEIVVTESVIVDSLEADNHGVLLTINPLKSENLISLLNNVLIVEANKNESQKLHEAEFEGSVTDGETEIVIPESSEASRKFLEKLEQGTESDEEVGTDEVGDRKDLFDSNALAVLLKAATNYGQDGSRLLSEENPAGLCSSLRALGSAAHQPNRPNIYSPSSLAVEGGFEDDLNDEEKNRLGKLQELRIKFLRLLQQLGFSYEDSIAHQVLYRFALTMGGQNSQSYSLDSAKRAAMQLEDGKDDLSFSVNILAIGKSGVGKSATINSIFGEERTRIDAFEPTTTSVKEIVGVVDRVKIRVFDTPGLRSSAMDQGFNNRLLASINKSIKRFPPDIVLYIDRLDSQTRNLNDIPLLKSITTSLGFSAWQNAIVAFTHAACTPPDGPLGSPMSYEQFVTQRSSVVQQSIANAIGDMRLMNPSTLNPVTLVENHTSCRKNKEGQKVLPNGQTWRPQLLLLVYSMKILSELSNLSKAQEPFDQRKLFGFRGRAVHLPYPLTWLLQSHSHPKLPSDQSREVDDSGLDLDDLSFSDSEGGVDEYDQLPTFKPLKRSQLAQLSRGQRRAYFEEYDYRVKLLRKKQLREDLKRLRDGIKNGSTVEIDAPATVTVPMPDLALPSSFDSDYPVYRYRFLEPTSQFVARPVLDTHGWDHDCGYNGVNFEHALSILDRFPLLVSSQASKDKNDFTLHLESSVATKHGDNGSSVVGFDIQNMGKHLAYVLRAETKLKACKNKATGGASLTFLGENVVLGVKIEDHIALGKRVVLVGTAGMVRAKGDAAIGANVEVRLRETDFPIGQNQSTLGISLVKWRGDTAIGGNFQSQLSMGRSSKMALRLQMNNKLSGQIAVKMTSSEQFQIVLMGIIPIAMSIYRNIWPGVAESYSIY